MQIKITPRTLGGTEFTAQPARLHLGAQNAEGVDRLVFQLPAEWAGCSVTLHIRHSDGTLAAPLVLDAAHSAPVGRSFTGWPAGQWMLAATDGSGYTAYTRPGRYDVYDILPTDGTEETASRIPAPQHRPMNKSNGCRLGSGFANATGMVPIMDMILSPSSLPSASRHASPKLVATSPSRR